MTPAPVAPLLIPRPASISLGGGWVSLAEDEAPVMSREGSPAHPEGYRLTIARDPPRARIAHRTEAGRRHGFSTLAQLRRQYGGRLPALEIIDEPAVATRGVMLDVSRDRIPTMGEFARLAQEFGALKINHLQLYTEHTFAYPGHEEVWRGWEPITGDEIRKIDGWCADEGIELAANQNCFGHLSRWLRHARYASLAETHGEWIFDRFKRSGPFSLCPGDPGSIRLVEDLLGQLLPHFRSGLVNVGCDETYDVGQGRSREAVESRGKAAVYFEHVDRVFEIVQKTGKRPMFWADVALSHPESVGRIADDAIALAWGYEADASFDRWCETLCGAGKRVWVCAGTSAWRSITGRTSTRRANLSAAGAAAARYALDGYLVTEWGDAGHRQVWPVALVALAEAADRAWNAGRAGDPDPRAISLHCFGDPSVSVAGWLDELGDADLPLRAKAGRAWFEGRGKPVHNASALFADLAEPWGSDAIALRSSDFEAVLGRLDGLRSRLAAIGGRGWTGGAAGNAELIRSELTHSLDRAEFAARRGVARRRETEAATHPGHGDGERRELREAGERILASHRRLWLMRSRAGLGLEDSLAQDRAVLDELGSG